MRADIRGESDPRWAAVLARDTRCDGAFVFAVRTTGIYCRPGCPARRPKRENVVFFESAHAAEVAGFRACLRCYPDRPVTAPEAIAQACQLIEASETPPSLDRLAQAAGLSRFHFHRVFKSELGMTPKQYADAVRQERARKTLAGGGSVTDAIYEAGYQNPARFYQNAVSALGMRPGDYRAGGRGQTIWYALADCAFGRALIAGTARGLCAIFLGESDNDLRADLEARFPSARLVTADEAVAGCVSETLKYIEWPDALFRLPLDIQGTAFQQKVWAALRDIPFGGTATYSDIARKIGTPSATRAVASACGANPVAVAVPCHRIVRADGGMGGYRWGVPRKQALLARERGND